MKMTRSMIPAALAAALCVVATAGCGDSESGAEPFDAAEKKEAQKDGGAPVRPPNAPGAAPAKK